MLETKSAKWATTYGAEEVMKHSNGLFYFESCHTSWCFDEGNLRFKRIPRPKARRASSTDFAHTKWESYFELSFSADSEQFTVVLNEAGSKLLRSWRHSENCIHCFGDDSPYETEELSLIKLDELLNRDG